MPNPQPRTRMATGLQRFANLSQLARSGDIPER
jgi:hypothetical protein